LSQTALPCGRSMAAEVVDYFWRTGQEYRHLVTRMICSIVWERLRLWTSCRARAGVGILNSICPGARAARNSINVVYSQNEILVPNARHLEAATSGHNPSPSQQVFQQCATSRRAHSSLMAADNISDGILAVLARFCFSVARAAVTDCAGT
jgi:hypothetical protein